VHANAWWCPEFSNALPGVQYGSFLAGDDAVLSLIVLDGAVERYTT